MTKTILFDLDGTLIDSTPAILESFESAFKAYGLGLPSHDKIESLVGYPLETIVLGLNAPQNLIDELVFAYKEHYKKVYLKKTTLLEFAKEALKFASQNGDVGIVTTKTTKYSIDILENLEVMKFIKTVVGRDDVKYPKPNPEPINLALTRLGKTSDEHRKNAFMIGDTVMDMAAARDAGINPLGVLCGYQSRTQLEERTRDIFKNSFEAVKYLSNL